MVSSLPLLTFSTFSSKVCSPQPHCSYLFSTLGSLAPHEPTIHSSLGDLAPLLPLLLHCHTICYGLQLCDQLPARNPAVQPVHTCCGCLSVSILREREREKDLILFLLILWLSCHITLFFRR